MAGHLTTHVLDTAQGRPAAGMEIELWRLDAARETRTLLRTARTNADGRTDAPCWRARRLTVGVYELVFAVGDYFARAGRWRRRRRPSWTACPCASASPIPTAHYHVPLLISPWAYSTYRGS